MLIFTKDPKLLKIEAIVLWIFTVPMGFLFVYDFLDWNTDSASMIVFPMALVLSIGFTVAARHYKRKADKLSKAANDVIQAKAREAVKEANPNAYTYFTVPKKTMAGQESAGIRLVARILGIITLVLDFLYISISMSHGYLLSDLIGPAIFIACVLFVVPIGFVRVRGYSMADTTPEVIEIYGDKIIIDDRIYSNYDIEEISMTAPNTAMIQRTAAESAFRMLSIRIRDREPVYYNLGPKFKTRQYKQIFEGYGALSAELLKWSQANGVAFSFGNLKCF